MLNKIFDYKNVNKHIIITFLGIKIKLKKNVCKFIKPNYINFFINGNARGLFHITSHINSTTGQPKVAYGSQQSAIKAANKMSEKKNCYFSVYKCIFCDGWHIGRNKENK